MIDEQTVRNMKIDELRWYREYLFWKRGAIRRELQYQSRLAYIAISKKTKTKNELKYSRVEALDDYLAGNITDAQYRRIINKWNAEFPLKEVYRKRIEECEEYIKEKDRDIAFVTALIRERGAAGRKVYDPTRYDSKYNRPGNMNPISPYEAKAKMYLMPKDRGRYIEEKTDEKTEEV